MSGTITGAAVGFGHPSLYKSLQPDAGFLRNDTAASDRETIDQLAEYFGPYPREDLFHLHNRRATLDLLLAGYNGENLQLADTIGGYITAELKQMPIMIVAPLTPWVGDSTEVTWDIWSFKRTLLDQLPEEAPNRIVESDFSMERNQILRYGIGLKINANFVKKDKGALTYLVQLKQIGDAVVQTAGLGVYAALVRGARDNSQSLIGRFERNSAFEKLLSEEIQMFGSIQKHRSGLNKAYQMLKEKHKKVSGRNGDVLVLPQGCRVFCQDQLSNVESETAVSTAVSTSSRAVDSSGVVASRTRFMGDLIYLLESQSFGDVDPMLLYLSIGHYYLTGFATGDISAESPFRTSILNETIYSEKDDEWRPLDYRTNLWRTGLWDHKRDPTNLPLTPLGQKYFADTPNYGVLYDSTGDLATVTQALLRLPVDAYEEFLLRFVQPVRPNLIQTVATTAPASTSTSSAAGTTVLEQSLTFTSSATKPSDFTDTSAPDAANKEFIEQLLQQVVVDDIKKTLKGVTLTSDMPADVVAYIGNAIKALPRAVPAAGGIGQPDVDVYVTLPTKGSSDKNACVKIAGPVLDAMVSSGTIGFVPLRIEEKDIPIWTGKAESAFWDLNVRIASVISWAFDMLAEGSDWNNLSTLKGIEGELVAKLNGLPKVSTFSNIPLDQVSKAIGNMKTYLKNCQRNYMHVFPYSVAIHPFVGFLAFHVVDILSEIETATSSSSTPPTIVGSIKALTTTGPTTTTTTTTSASTSAPAPTLAGEMKTCTDAFAELADAPTGLSSNPSKRVSAMMGAILLARNLVINGASVVFRFGARHTSAASLDTNARLLKQVWKARLDGIRGPPPPGSSNYGAQAARLKEFEPHLSLSELQAYTRRVEVLEQYSPSWKHAHLFYGPFGHLLAKLFLFADKASNPFTFTETRSVSGANPTTTWLNSISMYVFAAFLAKCYDQAQTDAQSTGEPGTWVQQWLSEVLELLPCKLAGYLPPQLAEADAALQRFIRVYDGLSPALLNRLNGQLPKTSKNAIRYAVQAANSISQADTDTIALPYVIWNRSAGLPASDDDVQSSRETNERASKRLKVGKKERLSAVDIHSVLRLMRLTNGQFTRFCVEHDVPTGIDILYAQPHAVYRAGLIISTFSGSGKDAAAVTFYQNPDFSMEYNGTYKTFHGNYTHYMSSVVTVKPKVLGAPNVYIESYVGGAGAAVYDMSDLSEGGDYQRYTSGDRCKDIIAVPVPAHTELETSIDLHGKFVDMLQDAMPVDECYPNSGMFMRHYRWSRATNPLSAFAPLNPKRLNNTFLRRGQSYSRRANGSIRKVTNTGFWGPHLFPGVAANHNGFGPVLDDLAINQPTAEIVMSSV